MRKPDGGTEVRITSHNSFTDAEVIEQIRNPADAIAVLEDGDKDLAGWGRRWLLQAKITPEDRGNVVAALARCLDTPDAESRCQAVEAYFHWADHPDVPTMLKILRFPSQYHDCWMAAFLNLYNASPAAAAEIIEERRDEPSFVPAIFGKLGDTGAKAVPLLKLLAKSKSPAIRTAAQGQQST